MSPPPPRGAQEPHTPPVSVRTSSHSTPGSTPHSFPPLEPPMVTEVWAGLRCAPRHLSAGSPPPARGHSFHSTQLAWGPATPPGAQPRPLGPATPLGSPVTPSQQLQPRPLQPSHAPSAAPATPPAARSHPLSSSSHAPCSPGHACPRLHAVPAVSLCRPHQLPHARLGPSWS